MKMKYLGFSEKAMSWFASYLSLREFRVNINQSLSDSGTITCGVPQGSILGPLLFLLYINDIPQAVDCEILLYADDTCVFYFSIKMLKKLKDNSIKISQVFVNGL